VSFNTSEFLKYVESISTHEEFEEFVRAIDSLPKEVKDIIYERIRPIIGQECVNYLQKNDAGIIVGVSQLSGHITAITHPNQYMHMIQVEEYDENLLGVFHHGGELTETGVVGGEFVPMLFFAHLDDENYVDDVVSHPDIPEEPDIAAAYVKFNEYSEKGDTLIPITKEQFQNIIGTRFDSETGEFIRAEIGSEMSELHELRQQVAANQKTLDAILKAVQG